MARVTCHLTLVLSVPTSACHTGPLTSAFVVPSVLRWTQHAQMDHDSFSLFDEQSGGSASFLPTGPVLSRAVDELSMRTQWEGPGVLGREEKAFGGNVQRGQYLTF